MACNVTLCDTVFANITDARIEIIAYAPPPRCLFINRVGNGVLPGGVYGAILTVAQTDNYDVIIDTTGTSYAPASISSLNGAGSSPFDVVLNTLALPSSVTTGRRPIGKGPGSTRSRPTTSRSTTSRSTRSTMTRSFVLNQTWPEELTRLSLLEAEIGHFWQEVDRRGS